MRDNKYDIVFDEPHFISWREENLRHEVLVKLPGKLQFVLVTDKSNKKVGKAKNLIGKNICGISPSNVINIIVTRFVSLSLRALKEA